MEKGKRKREILGYLVEKEEVTPRELSEDLHIEIHNARVLLKRYWLEGLLSRKMQGMTAHYRIKERGYERLQFLSALFIFPALDELSNVIKENLLK